MSVRTAGVVGQGHGRAERGRVRLLAIPVDTFCDTEGYAEKALRELALRLLPPPGSDHQRAGAERALGRTGFTELTQLFFDLAEHADDFMPVRDVVALHVQRARSAGASHVDVRLPRVCAQTSVQFNELLDSVERLSAGTVLSTPAPSVMVTRFRRWYLEQIHAQLGAGTAPQRFPG